MTLKDTVKCDNMQSLPRSIQDASNYLATMFQKLLSVQARFGPIFTLFCPNDLEGQGQTSPYAIPSVTICNPIQDLSKMHLTAKFGGPSFNPSKVIECTSPFWANFDHFWPK